LLISKGDFINEHTSDNIREDYQIGKVLGTGAFGEVRVCTHRKSNIKRAVKILKKNFLKEEERNKFFHEIEVLKNVVSYSNLSFPIGPSKYCQTFRSIPRS
jgi:serine/threonine protein kinase